MNTRDEYIRKLQQKLDEWNTDIDALAAKARETTTDVKNEYNEQIESLKARQVEARHKIDELRQAGEGAWEDLKSGVELAWSAMAEAIDSVRSRFK